MNELEQYQERMFEEIRHVDEEGREFWYARELAKALEYKRWDKFKNVINKAVTSCSNSGNIVDNHFSQLGRMVSLGSDALREVSDYKLSRYACYLITQNADSSKKVVALGQTYFAIQTRKQEILSKNYEDLTETEKRFYKREKIRRKNLALNRAARDAGVKNFDKFHNAGYKGLYNGETAGDIAKRKGLRYREDILDNMGSDELAANEFRISLASQKLKNENIQGEANANYAHFEVGSIVRCAIIEAGGTVPEKLPTPEKSLKELKKEELKKIDGGSSVSYPKNYSFSCKKMLDNSYNIML